MARKLLAGLALAAMALVAGLHGTAWVIGGPVYAGRYLRAFTHSPTEPPFEWYAPTETVKGGPGAPLPRSDPAAEGVDGRALAAAAAYAAPRNTRALVVVRNGKVVLERYWRGGSAELRFSSHSFHKSLVAMLVGIAIAEGRIPSVDEPASRWLTEWAGDERRRITVRDLLQMQSGLQPPDFSFLPWSVSMRTYITADLARDNLALPLAGTPGETWGHHNADSVALGDWTRIGEMLRNDGAFDGRQILPAGWVARMRTPARGNASYGYQLWLGHPYAPRRSYSPARPQAAVNLSSEPYAAADVFFLDGFGKRRLWIIPSAGLVILREGTDPDDWDDSRIPNIILRGIDAPVE